MNSVTVKAGVSTVNLESLVGKTVGHAREVLSDVLNFSRDWTARLTNLGSVDDNYILEAGSSIEFVKPASAKGLC